MPNDNVKPGFCTCGRVLFITNQGPGCLNAKCPRNVCSSLHDAARMRADERKRRAPREPAEPKSVYGATHL